MIEIEQGRSEGFAPACLTAHTAGKTVTRVIPAGAAALQLAGRAVEQRLNDDHSDGKPATLGVRADS